MRRKSAGDNGSAAELVVSLCWVSGGGGSVSGPSVYGRTNTDFPLSTGRKESLGKKTNAS